MEKKEQEKICLKLSSLEIPPKQPQSQEPPKTQNIIEEKPKKSQEQKSAPPKKVEKKETKPIQEAPQKEEPKIEQAEKIQGDAVQENFAAKSDNALHEIQKEKVPTKEETTPEDDYIKVNTQKIAQLIQDNLSYPISARRKGITGVVTVKFCLSVDAKVSNIRVVESNSELLSRSAIKTIEELSEKFPKPSKEVNLSVPINYSLN